MNYEFIESLSYQCLLDLATSEGINASSRSEIYGCIFGRDSAITILKLLNVYKKLRDEKLLSICKTALLTHVVLQGKEQNIQSGEEIGKFIHEFRKDNYRHLIEEQPVPWYVYSDGVLRNYDSIDSTPLMLIALYNYVEITNDLAFLAAILPSVEKGLQWLLTLSDKDNDHLVEYEIPSLRTYGGLPVQSWTDSHESLLQSDGSFPLYPIAPIEVQGYAWLALRLWSQFFAAKDELVVSEVLSEKAEQMKKRFNSTFVIVDNYLYYGAQALDGNKNQILTITANPLLCLWATDLRNEKPECILEDKYISDFVKRGFRSDMFDSDAGIRTMSSDSPTFNPNNDSYHNGSFWPVLNGMIYEGFMKWDFVSEASDLKEASIKPIKYFQSPIELYTKTDKGYGEYLSSNGQKGCKYQAWSAAAVLDMVLGINKKMSPHLHSRG